MTSASDCASRPTTHFFRRLALGATVALVALAVTAGPVDAAAHIKGKIKDNTLAITGTGAGRRLPLTA